MLKIRHKRGDTFSQVCTVRRSALDGETPDADGLVPWDITAVGIRAQLRDGDALLAELTVTKIDAAVGLYRLRHAHDAATNPTTAWPVKLLHGDIEYTVDGDVVSTETFTVDMKADVTR